MPQTLMSKGGTSERQMLEKEQAEHSKQFLNWPKYDQNLSICFINAKQCSMNDIFNKSIFQ